MDRIIAPQSLPQVTAVVNSTPAQPLRNGASDAFSLDGSTQDSQDEKFTDSGYASRNSSCRIAKSAKPSEGPLFIIESKLFRRKARELHFYNKEIPRSTWDRFYALKELHGQSLLDSLSTQRALDSLTKRRRRFGAHSISTKLKVLGETEATAKPWVVVLCDEADYRGVRNFYNQKHVIADHQGPHADADLPSLEVIIHPRSPEPAAANDYPGLYASWAAGGNLDTLCGQVIRVSESSQAKIATLGGIIKIATSEDEFMLYGLTVGHVFQRDDIDFNYDSEMESEEEDEGIELFCIEETYELDLGPFSDLDSETISESNSPLQGIELGNACSRVGHVVMTSNNLSDRKGDLDWAIVEIEDLSLFRPNLVTQNRLGQRHLTKIGLSELCSSPQPAENRAVLVLSGLGGIKKGLLSTYPSFINLPNSKTFIETYTLSLGTGFKIQNGDCGSWVVDSMTYQVYGQIVASDIMNEAYIVPLPAIFNQIKKYPGANHVRLAGENDIQKWRSRHTEGKALVRKGAQRSHGVGDIAPISQAQCMNMSGNIQRPKMSTKPSARNKRFGAVFSESTLVQFPNQLLTDQSVSDGALSPSQVPSTLLTSPASNTQQPKLYTPPSLASFYREKNHGSRPELDMHGTNQAPFEWATTQSPNDSDSLSWHGLPPEVEIRDKGAFTSPRTHNHSKKSPVSLMEEMTSLVSDQLHEATLLEYRRQYGTLAPWTEVSAQPALKNSGWDSGYSTAESANHSPAP